MGRKKRTATKRAEKKTSLVDIMPYVFIIAVVPLIVYLYVDKLEPIEVSNWGGGDQYYDLLSWWKSRWFIIASSLGLCLFVIRSIQGRIQIGWKPGLHIPSALYILFIILSTITSRYVSVALNGFVARYEGMLVLLFYVLDMIILTSLVRDERHLRIISGSLLVSAFIICLIGLSQLAGYNFFNTGFGKSLILPAEYAASELVFKFGTMVYGTLANPNYVGSYVALVFPIAVAAIFLARKTAFRIGAGILSALLLVILIGSDSGAGLVGFGAGALIAVIYFRKYIFRHKIIIILAAAVALAGLGLLGQRVMSEINAGIHGYYVEEIIIEGNSARIVSSTETLTVRHDAPYITFHNADNHQLKIDVSDAEQGRTIRFIDPAYGKYTLTLSGEILWVRNGEAELALRIRQDSLALVGNRGEDTQVIAKPEAINVKGFEKLGSARAYIWSRAIPLLKNKILVGSGPDSFAIEFPQDDYIGKINAYNTPYMIVDKAHNLYLQIAVNTGVLSLLAFMALIAVYAVSSVRLYFVRPGKSPSAYFGAAIFIGICSYLAAGLFNDSVIAVAPVFWALLGMGFACNSMSAREQK